MSALSNPCSAHFERNSPFTPESGLPCSSLTRYIDDHGSLIIFRSVSALDNAADVIHGT
jgi:hypothetical protein